MDTKDLFTVMITGADNEIASFVSDCVIVVSHKVSENGEPGSEFSMSLNTTASGATLLMLLDAMDRAKQQILESDPKLNDIYEEAKRSQYGN